MAQHTKEPWVYDASLPAGVYSDDVTGSIIATCEGFGLAPRPGEERAANARRIVACVNACAGIPTGALEAIAALPERVTRLMTLRDRADFHAMYGTAES